MVAGEINSKPQTITGKLREDRAPRPLLIAAEGTAHNPDAGEDALAQLAHDVRQRCPDRAVVSATLTGRDGLMRAVSELERSIVYLHLCLTEWPFQAICRVVWGRRACRNG